MTTLVNIGICWLLVTIGLTVLWAWALKDRRREEREAEERWPEAWRS